MARKLDSEACTLKKFSDTVQDEEVLTYIEAHKAECKYVVA